MDQDFSIYKEMLNNLYEGVYFVDMDRKITFWNKGAERITGFTAQEVMGHHCYDNILNHMDDNSCMLCKEGCPLQKTIIDGQNREAGVYLLHKNGHRVAVAIRAIPIVINGKIAGAVEFFMDDKKQAWINNTINELKTFALYDQLTDLPNRRYIDSFLKNRFSEYKEFEIPFALLMIDIDHFKKVNDSFGHNIGDIVIKMVAKTLQSVLRKNDFIGRWGGEEFLAVITEASDDDVKAISEKMRSLIEKSVVRDISQPLSVTVSIGSTLIRKKDTITSIKKRADQAMYISKNSGRNQTTFI